MRTSEYPEKEYFWQKRTLSLFVEKMFATLRDAFFGVFLKGTRFFV